MARALSPAIVNTIILDRERNEATVVVADDQLEAAAQSYVEDMLLASPMGLRMTKEGLNMAVDAASLEAAMAIENRNQLMTAASPNFAEGMRAFLEKRRPDYIPD
jgi:enoyl-CoA hydratase/carnithine racemase